MYNYTHTHIYRHTHIYIYNYIHICVCISILRIICIFVCLFNLIIRFKELAAVIALLILKDDNRNPYKFVLMRDII